MLAEQTTYEHELGYGEQVRVLIVEDDNDIASMLRDHLEHSLSAEITIAASADKAIELDAAHPAEVILIDYMLPDVDGVELIASLNEPCPERPAMLITGHATLGRAISAMRCGVVDMFLKPFDLEVLTAKVAEAVTKYRAQQLRFKRLQQVRRLSKRVIRDRRELRQKLDLVCRDLVGAYHDLAVKVTEIDRNTEQGQIPTED